MGQYWIAVNLDKREFIDAHSLGCGIKLWEMLANHPSPSEGLMVLCAAMPEPRGGGDFDLEENWHGPERIAPGPHSCSPGPMPDTYPEIAKATIGRWAGDRIAIVGDYAVDSDLAPEHKASTIYARCLNDEDVAKLTPEERKEVEDLGPLFKDVSPGVRRVLEHELGGKFERTQWGGWAWKEPEKAGR